MASIKDLFVQDNYIRLPVTFDYKGGRFGKLKSAITMFLVSLTVYTGSLIFIFTREATLVWKFIILVLVSTLYFFFTRFAVFSEGKYRSILDSKKEDDSTTYWGIHTIAREYPYVCDFVDGKRAIFVALSKDVFVGKGDSVVTEHYDAVATAYSLAERLKVDIVALDYMDTVGNDTRIKDMFSELVYCTNPKLKKVMNSMYKNLLGSMEDEFTSYDVYCIFTTSKSVDMRKVIRVLVAEFLNGNYIAYKVLDSSGIRSLCQVLFNNPAFSLIDACDKALNINSFKSFKPLFHLDESNNVTNLDSMGEVIETIKEEPEEDIESLLNEELKIF